ncbi:MAG: right-handed parallel beta-helix repeat-containing protein [Eubacterium sp.]|nr:right-handed parallel beta-helix repeat-containing protein [Eubacterium sp.]
MKQKLAIILCIFFILTSGNTLVFAAGQPTAERSARLETAEDITEDINAVGIRGVKKETVVKPTAAGIQEKLNINKDGQYDLTVIIPPGTYPLTKTLYVHPNTTIIADGATLVKQRNYGAMLEAKLTDDYGGYGGNHDITIQGGTWDSTPCMRNSGTESLRFIHCNNITIRDAKFCNVPGGSHLVVLAGVKNATITNCEFSGYGTDPQNGYLSAKVPKEAIQLDVVRKEVVPTGQTAEIKNWDDLPCDTVTVSGCRFHEFSRGIGSHTAVAGMLHNRVTIENNTFENLSDSAVRLYNYKNSVIKGNRISNAVEGILVYTCIGQSGENAYFQPKNGVAAPLPTEYNITVSDNIIKDIADKNGVWGDGIRVIGGKTRELSGVTVRNNWISEVSRYGIFATEAPDLTITNNRIEVPEKDGIFVSMNSRNASILNNKIFHSGHNGIALTSFSRYSTIQGNTVTEYGMENKKGARSGIIVYLSGGNSRDNTVVMKNKITGTGKKSGRNAIHLSGSSYVTVSGNTINKADGSGIYLYQSKNSVIGKTKKDTNTIKNPKEYGIYITSASLNVKAQYNKITGAKTAGVGVYDARKSTVKGNVISSEKDGINVSVNSVSAMIAGNTINSAGRRGISLSDGSGRSTIKDNTIKKYSAKKASGSGIYISRAGGTGKKSNTVVSGNKVTGTGKSKKKNAIKVTESAYTTLKKNTIKSAAGNGIFISGSGKNTIENNKISAPRKNGICISKGSRAAKIKGNTVTKAGDVSIMLYNAPFSQVISNKVTGSKKYIGIWARASDRTTIKNNTIKGAKKEKAVSVRGSQKCKVTKNKVSTGKAQKKQKTSKGKTQKTGSKGKKPKNK